MNQIFPHYSINNKPKVCASPRIRRLHVEQTGNNSAVSPAVLRRFFVQCDFYAPFRQWLVLLNPPARQGEAEASAAETEQVQQTAGLVKAGDAGRKQSCV